MIKHGERTLFILDADLGAGSSSALAGGDNQTLSRSNFKAIFQRTIILILRWEIRRGEDTRAKGSVFERADATVSTGRTFDLIIAAAFSCNTAHTLDRCRTVESLSLQLLIIEAQ